MTRPKTPDLKPGTTVLFPFRGSRIGGSHVATFELVDALKREGTVRPTLVLNGPNEIADAAQARGLEVRFTAEPADRRRNWPWVEAARMPWRISWLRRQGGSLLVHNNDMGTQQSWGVAAALAGAPVVFHNHAFNRMVPPNTTLVRLARRTLCVSDACRQAVAFLPDRQVDTVLNPIEIPQDFNPSAARPRLLSELGLTSDVRLIGFVGNFWKRKRPAFAIEAFAALHREDPRSVLVFFGRDGDVSQVELEALAGRLSVGEHVRFVGFRQPAEENVAALDLLMMPAVSEPFGRTLIEAALLQTPYVATDDAGHHEIGRRWGGGRLANKDLSADDFATLALQVMNAPGTVTLDEGRRALVRSDFSADEHARHVLAAYRRALQPKAVAG